MAKADNAMLGSSGYERVENDHYPTEEPCTLAVYRYLKNNRLLPSGAVVYEPACGDGAISKVFEKLGHTVISSDLHPQYAGAPVKNFLTDDFMIDREAEDNPVIVTNPPYAQPWIDLFMQRAIDLVENDGFIATFLMRKEVDSALSRRKFFADCPFYFGKLDLLWRPRWIPGSTGSPRHNYSWYTWAPKRFVTRPTIEYAQRPKG